MPSKSHLAIIAAISLGYGSMAAAFDLPKMPGAGAQQANAAPIDAVSSQEAVVRNYVDAATDINQAQIHLANAFGLKSQAAALQETADALKAGAVDESVLKKQIELSESVNAEVEKRIGAGEQLSDEAKAEYANSLQPFGRGVIKVSKLGPDLTAFSDSAKQQISAASLIEKAQVTKKLSTGMYLVSSVPGFVTNTGSALKQIVTYGQDNKIPVPEDATAALDI